MVMGTGDWYYNSSNGLQYPATVHGVTTVQDTKIEIMDSKQMGNKAKIEKIVVDRAKLEDIVVDRAKVSSVSPNEERIVKSKSALVSDVERIAEAGENKESGEMKTSVVERSEEEDVYGQSSNVVSQDKNEMEEDVMSPVKVAQTLNVKEVHKSKSKKSLPAWMEKMEKQLGMMNIQDLANL